MVLKGPIPVLDEQYDLSSAEGLSSTAMTVVAGILGVAMMLGIFSAGRSLWNSLSQSSDQLNTVELL